MNDTERRQFTNRMYQDVMGWKMIEPIVSLAFSLHANKGVYALLLGSGVSRSAGIPTGWEVVKVNFTRFGGHEV